MPFFTGNVQGGEELIGGDVPGTTAAIAAEELVNAWMYGGVGVPRTNCVLLKRVGVSQE